MSLLDVIISMYNTYCPFAGTYIGDAVLWLILNTPNFFMGMFFTDSNTGLAPWWAIAIDNMIDDLGVLKGDH